MLAGRGGTDKDIFLNNWEIQWTTNLMTWYLYLWQKQSKAWSRYFHSLTLIGLHCISPGKWHKTENRNIIGNIQREWAPGMKTLQQCQRACVEEEDGNCKSFTFRRTDQTCILRSVNEVDFPEDNAVDYYIATGKWLLMRSIFQKTAGLIIMKAPVSDFYQSINQSFNIFIYIHTRT